METLKNNMKVYDLSEIMDNTLGAERRIELERMAEAEMKAKGEKSHTIRIPASIYNNIQKKASSMGVSVSAFVRQAFAML